MPSAILCRRHEERPPRKSAGLPDGKLKAKAIRSVLRMVDEKLEEERKEKHGNKGEVLVGANENTLVAMRLSLSILTHRSAASWSHFEHLTTSGGKVAQSTLHIIYYRPLQPFYIYITATANNMFVQNL